MKSIKSVNELTYYQEMQWFTNLGCLKMVSTPTLPTMSTLTVN